MIVSSFDHRQQPLKTGSLLLALLCAVIWSGQGIAVKLAVLELPPYLIVSLRHLIAIPFLFGWMLWTGSSFRLDPGKFCYVLMNALFVCISMVLFVFGTEGTTSSRSMILVNSFPLFSAIFCSLLLVDSRISIKQSISLLIAFMGVVLILYSPEESTLAGEILVLFSAAAIGLKVALVRYLLLKLESAPLVFWTTVLTSLICGILSFLFEHAEIKWNNAALLAVCYQGIMVSALGSLLWTSLLSRHNPHDLTPFQLLAPALGILAGVVFLSEPLTLRMILGSLCVLAGLGLVLQGKPRVAKVEDGLTE
ncbi:MAG TPA: hypothetical protein DIW81_10410 [Planctomycetaceae bacterium]|nr:hypothetical protein [Rubinisphaera sp.]HCS51989.1 hypothetical protein [Planctomycetaceae bacterium]